MKFEELDLHPSIMDALRQSSISECTPIQESAIPLVLEGKDISGLSQTGTGKTFAFLVPLIERILRTKNKEKGNPTELDLSRAFDSWHRGHYILVLAPTRELADQIHKAILKICTPETGLKSALVYGGVEYEAQTAAINNGADIVVGTPGRLLDLYKNHHINFKQIKAIVFDEADRMFDMGFKDDMVYILQRAPEARQILLFSATLNFDVMNTVYRFDSNPVEINVSRDQAKAADVTDEIFHVGETEKPAYLLSLFNKIKPKQTIIFSNFKMNVDRIAQFLSSNGIPAVGISSLLTQSQRERVLEQFKNEGERNTLVATDVAARGLDIKGVDLVINYDLPDDAENYIHRIGRTGRAGAKGHAISLVSDRDVMALSRIEGYTKTKLSIGWLEEEFLVKDFKEFTRSNFKKESRVKKTGLAAMKAQAPRRDTRNDHGERRPKHDGKPHRQRRDGGPEQHRDRKSGRHKNNQEQHFTNGAAPKPQHAHKPKTHNKSTAPARNTKRSPQQKRRSFKQAKPTPSLTQKVKGFFKGLFR